MEPLLSDSFVVKEDFSHGPVGSKTGRSLGKKASKKSFCEFFADGTVTVTARAGSIMSGTGSSTKAMKWAPDWDMQVVDAQQLLLRMGEGHSLTLVADEAAVTSKWAQTMGSVFARRKALDAERSRVRQAVTMANLAAPAAVATSARARRMARSENDAASGEAASMDRQILEAGLYQFLCNNSATYADQLASVPSTVRNAVNEVFQQLTAEYLTSMDFDNATPEKRAVAVSLISLVEDFLETAQHYGRIIISEVFIPPREKTIKPVQVGGVIGGEKFIVGNVLFKFAIDMGVFEGDHASAAKVAGLELQGLRSYYATQTNGLHFPLMAMIDKKGFRLIASTLLPLKKLIYGSNDAAHTIHRENDAMNKLLELAGQQLNLKPHVCGMTPEASKLMYSCVDLEGHEGHDDRFYLLDFSRTMPPVTPARVKTNSHLFEMFRAEFVAKYPRPLSPDAYSRFTATQPDFERNNKEVDKALQSLFTSTIPEFAMLFKERFDHYKGLNVDLTKFRLSALLHEKGINVRYLGRLVHSLVGDEGLVKASAGVGFLDLLDDDEGQKRYGEDKVKAEDDSDLRPADFLVMEMVARVAKNLVRSRLRFKMEQLRVPVDGPFKGVVVQLLNQLFALNKESSEFWTNVLLPAVEQKFGFDLKQLYKGIVRKAMFKRNGVPYLMWQRLCDMLGLQFAPTIRELMQSEPDVFEMPTIFSVADLMDLGDRVKTLDFISVARGYLASVKAAEMEEAGLLDLAEAAWKKAEQHYSDALMHRPDDPLRMSMVARVLAHLGKVTKATGDNPMMVRALSLSERATTMASLSDAVEVKLTRAIVLDACGQKEQSERMYMSAVLEHSDSLKCIAAYTRFLKTNGEEKLAVAIELDVYRKSNTNLADLVPRVRELPPSALLEASSGGGPPAASTKKSKLLSLRDKKLTGSSKKDALTAISGAKHSGLGDFRLSSTSVNNNNSTNQ